ncbi:MAG: tail fiber domain-containing protein [Burkholderiales bacterium]
MRKSMLIAAFWLIFVAPARGQFCPGVSPWVFDDVLASDPFCGFVTWMADNGITLGCQTIDANHRLYCPAQSVSRLQMAAFMNRLGNVRVEAVGTGPGLTGGPITSVGTINLATTQLLPTTPCFSNQIARWNGSAWACANDANSGGTVTSVGSGAGLTGGPITAAGSLSIATGYQLPQGCANGQVAKSNGSNAWTCANDTNSGGTVTSVATGSGLTGGPITASGTIGLAATQLLPTVACANGQVPQWNGSAWACATPGSFSGNVNLPNSTSSTVGNVTKPGGAFLHNFGTNNTFAGVNAGNFTMAGTSNAALGTFALNANNTGSNNTASGTLALNANTTGNDNTATGLFALGTNTTGNDNTATGSGALLMNTLGNRNTALGRTALASNTTGNNNVAVGKDAAGQNKSGANNVAVGTGALASNDVGSGSTAVGTNALAFSVAGGNSAFGSGALEVNTTGDGNTAVGASTLNTNTIGVENTGLGEFALFSNTGGSSSTAIGARALFNATGNGNIGVGFYAGWNLRNGSDNVYLANYGTFAESQTTRLGSVQSRAFIAGVRGITTGWNNAIAVLIDQDGQLGTLSSSRKVKDDVADMGDASDVLMKLHPVIFRYKAHHGAGPIQYGLIAEEVAEVAPGLVATGRDGEIETVYYQHLAPMLLNEFQKQRRTIEAQQAEIAELRRMVQSMLAR